MDYLYEEETRKIIGCSFKVYNTLGYGYKEKEVQRAIASEFTQNGLKFERELYSKLVYNGEVIAGFYVDFLVDGKIVVEIKVANEVYKKHFDQVLAYLKNHNLQLGLIIVFTPKKVLVKRIINQNAQTTESV